MMLACWLSLALLAGGARIDSASLAREIPSREALAQWPALRPVLASNTKLLKWEEHDGRHEALLLDAQGPGAIVRLWLKTVRGRLRLYLGDASTPAFEGDITEFLGPRPRFPAFKNSPLELARFPLCFATHARLTLEDSETPEFEVAWRTYPAGSEVADFARPNDDVLHEVRARWDEVPKGPEGQLSFTFSLSQKNPAGEFLATDPKLAAGPRAVTALVLRVDGPDPDLAARSLVLHLAFDGEETVVCPLTQFFRALELEPRGRALWTRDYAARWIMPYQKQMDLLVENLGPATTHVSGSVNTQPWVWNERSLHFGARWIGARGASRLAIEGQGTLLGITAANIPNAFPRMESLVDGNALPLWPALALLDRPFFEKSFVFEQPARETPEPQRIALFYVRPGAVIHGRELEPADLPSLLGDR